MHLTALITLVITLYSIHSPVAHALLSAVLNTTSTSNYTLAARGKFMMVPIMFSGDGSAYYLTGANVVDGSSVETNYVMNNEFPDVLVPLIGVNGGLCTSALDPVMNAKLPCAVYGFFRTQSQRSWLEYLYNSSQQTDMGKLPFHCSARQPCSIRTPDPADGEVGGCSSDTTTNTNTLVVVTWNNSRYIFRPLLFFAGVGAIHVVPTQWPNGTTYDGGLSFGNLNSDTDNITSMCVMSLVYINGTVDVFSVDEDDLLSPTGLRRLTTLSPSSSLSSSTTKADQECLPTFQHVPAPDSMSGPLLSLTCVSGEGWLWQVSGSGNSSLVGHYALPPPPSSISGQPLVVDITVVQVQGSDCTPGLVTAIALSGQPLLQAVPRSPAANDDTRTLTFGVYISTQSLTKKWLTQQLFCNSTSGGTFTIEKIGEPLRVGLGWVLPTALPVEALYAMPSNCESIAYSALSWVAASALYGAFTSDRLVMISPQDGQLGKSTGLEIVDYTQLKGGALFGNPTRIGSQSLSFLRYPSSASGGTSIVMQTKPIGIDGTAHSLVSSNGQTIAYPISYENHSLAQGMGTEWLWQEVTLTSPLNSYTPTAVSIRYNVPLSSQDRISFFWADDLPVFFATDHTTATSGLVIGASANYLPQSIGVSFDNVGVAPISVESEPLIYVCHGHTVTAYDYTFGIVKWTNDQISSDYPCASGDCGCDSSSTIHVVAEDAMVLVVFTDFLQGTNGIMVLDVDDGSLRSYLNSAYITLDPISTECSSMSGFGTLQSFSESVAEEFSGIVMPMINSSCILMGELVPNGTSNDFVWNVFVVAAEGVSLSGQAVVDGSSLLVYDAPALEGPDYGGRLFGLDLFVMTQVFAYNPDASIFGINPTYTLTNVLSSVAENGLVITLELISYENTTGPFSIQLNVVDSGTGESLWNTSGITLQQDLQPIPPQLLTTFLLVQADGNGIATWACVAAGALICIVVDTVPSTAMIITYSFSCIGAPAASAAGYLLWTTEGYAPVCIRLNTESNGWHALSETIPLPFSINQTSCTDAHLANSGVIMLCSPAGSTDKRLTIVDAVSGMLLFAHGPLVLPGTLSVSVDGKRVTFLEENTGTVWSLLLATKDLTATYVPLATVMCSNNGESFFVLSIDSYAGTVQATSTSLDPTVAIIDKTYTGRYNVYASYAFTQNYQLSLDSQVELVGTPAMVNALSDALPPSVRQVLADAIYVTALSPSYISSTYAGNPLMAATACVDCFLNCPSLCTLNIVTGDQKQYTAKMRSIDTVTKRSGDILFNASGLNQTTIPYSGDVNLNLLRCQAGLSSFEQIIPCQEEPSGLTTSPPDGRYCFLSFEFWSVIELVNGGQSFAASYNSRSPGGGITAQGTQYYGYSVWTTRPVLTVNNELSLVAFFGQNLVAIPQKILNRVITSVNNVTIGPNDVLTVTTDAGDLLYTAEACTNQTDLLQVFPMCRSTFRLFDRGTMVDEQIATVVWNAPPSSNWGEGFVSTDYKVKVSEIMRGAHSGTPILCHSNQESNPLCSVVCQPTVSCDSQIQADFDSFLSLTSWLPRGSSYSASNGPCSVTSNNNETDANALFPLRFYGSPSGDVIATSQVNGVEVVIFYSSLYPPNVFGVTFSVSRCVFFTLSNVVAQPFTWLAICAVKSLLLTFLFYYVEHRILGREAKREALRSHIARLASHITTERREEAIQDSGAEGEEAEKEEVEVERRSSRMVPINRTPWQVVADRERFEELRACELEEQQLGRHCGGSTGKSLVDRYDSLMAHLSAFRHPVERASHAKTVRRNVLYKDMEEDALVEMLLFVLKEDRREAQVVRSFAVFYELSMCNNRNWVVRQQPLVHSGSERMTRELAEELRHVHKALHEVYNHFLQFHLESHQRKNTEQADLQHSIPQDSSVLLGLLQSHETSVNLSADFARPHQTSSLKFNALVDSFNRLHDGNPNCFEFAVMSSRRMEGRLQPSSWLIALSLLQSAVTVFLYFIDVYIRSHSTSLTALQMYECVCFMVFNSSLPSSLIVNAVLHVDLSPDMQATTPIEWLKRVLRSPFVLLSLLLVAPPLITHIIPGLILYCWALLPPIALAVTVERLLRSRSTQSSRTMLAARIANRVFILLVVSIAFSIAYNVADMYIWKWVKGDEPFPTGSYIQQHYLSSLEQDYDSRSLACVWEHLLSTMSNFLQMGFFLV